MGLWYGDIMERRISTVEPCTGGKSSFYKQTNIYRINSDGVKGIIDDELVPVLAQCGDLIVFHKFQNLEPREGILI